MQLRAMMRRFANMPGRKNSPQRRYTHAMPAWTYLGRGVIVGFAIIGWMAYAASPLTPSNLIGISGRYCRTVAIPATVPMRRTAKANCGSIPRPVPRPISAGILLSFLASPAKSELVKRVTAAEGLRMPPAWAGAARLSEREIGLLTRWIEQGAVWQKHWSFIPPVRPELPAVSDRALAQERDRLLCACASGSRRAQAIARSRPAYSDPAGDARPDGPAADAGRGRSLRA